MKYGRTIAGLTAVSAIALAVAAMRSPEPATPAAIPTVSASTPLVKEVTGWDT